MAVRRHRARQRWAWLSAAVWLLATPLHAAPLPGPADAGRVDQREMLQPSESHDLEMSKPMRVLPAVKAPEQSKHMTMTLREVRIVGMTAFKRAQMDDIYAPFLDREITMDTVWLIAGQMTERYRNAGYFLSKVTVPQQEINDGIVTLRVVEGYIGEIKFDDELAQHRIVKTWLAVLQSYRPLKAAQIENVLLQLNDLPGVNLHAVLEPMPMRESETGAVRLTLERKAEPKVGGQVSIDNNGSKFLGPYEAMMQTQAVILPQQKTTVTLLSTLPWDELKYGSLKQEIPIIAGGNLELYGAHTNANPGYTLEPQDIKSDSMLLGVAFNYKMIRQREENLTGRVAFESRDTSSDILGTPLTRDSIRALRANLVYETMDGWRGYNAISGTVSHGLGVLDASKAGELNLSRAEAKPDFTKFEASINRTQPIYTDWALATGAEMQVASGALYSSEEFGYGGQNYGRAYDESEITGDHGVAATAELRYNGFSPSEGVQPVPYVFYDVGLVWNKDQDQEARASGSSVGAGVKVLSDQGFNANVGVAFPLTREIANPIYGSGKNPRYVMQLTYGF